jgi:hypothetical protein
MGILHYLSVDGGYDVKRAETMPPLVELEALIGPDVAFVYVPFGDHTVGLAFSRSAIARGEPLNQRATRLLHACVAADQSAGNASGRIFGNAVLLDGTAIAQCGIAGCGGVLDE